MRSSMAVMTAPLAGGVVAIGFALAAATPAAAAPNSIFAGAKSEDTTLHQVYAYRRSCGWVDGGWRYRRAGIYADCRPYRPVGRSWVWQQEGARQGWYNPGRKQWHHNKW
jgi:hypothetical protein